MAYNRESRFPPNPRYYRFLDPGAYQYDAKGTHQNAAPFLVKTPRSTSTTGPIYTDSIYNPNYGRNIPNCSAFLSRTPRFPYEPFGPKDLEELLCRCGLNVCQCPVGEEILPKIICHRKAKKTIFKGTTRQIKKISNVSSHKICDVPFYDPRVNEFTQFYRGWKWSKWTSNRTHKDKGDVPGPADYILESEKPAHEKCAEKLREKRRLNSKQFRFIELVQRQNILEGKPAPNKYNPQLPTGPELQIYGPRAERFQKTAEDDISYPGPADYCIKRSFDRPQFPDQICKARLPEPTGFGVTAARFGKQIETGPSPADYTINDKVCNFVHCQQGAFNNTEVRFKVPEFDGRDDTWQLPEKNESCPNLTWTFRSKSIRMKTSKKELQEPSPADCPLQCNKIERSKKLQYIAPFASSEGRFTPWFDWLPIYGREEIPGPCYYELEQPKCYPAVKRGPLTRSERFPRIKDQIPAPNEYKLGGGFESVLATHNAELKKNIKNRHTFIWEPPKGSEYLTPEERETQILTKCIALLDYEDGDEMTGYAGYIQDKLKRKTRMEKERKEKERKEKQRIKKERLEKKLQSMKTETMIRAEELTKDKLLRCFLYKSNIPMTY